MRTALRQGHEVNGLIDLRNQNGHYVVGISPLYIAAQGGRTRVCELLLRAGSMGSAAASRARRELRAPQQHGALAAATCGRRAGA